jgi:hypothetical protein
MVSKGKSGIFLDETITVGAVSNKFGNGSVKSGEEWLGLNDGVSLESFERGKTYKVKVKISPTSGKRYLEANLGEVDGEAAEEQAPVAPTTPAVSKPVGVQGAPAVVKKSSDFRSREEIMRSTAIEVASESDFVKTKLVEAETTNEARQIVVDYADFVLHYIVNGKMLTVEEQGA